jgi:RNA polymerase sigma-70 factor, ECF subfamily
MSDVGQVLKEERALVERCLDHDPRAWETMVQSHAKRIFGLCYRSTGRKDEAEDLTQEILIRVYQNLASFQTESGCLQGWILRLGRNLIIDHYRHESRLRRAARTEELDGIDLEDLNAANPYRAAEQQEKSAVLMKALLSLPGEIKQAIVLRDLQGMTYQEMAAALGAPVGTMKSRVSRGHVKLAEELSRQNSSSKPCLCMRWRQVYA